MLHLLGVLATLACVPSTGAPAQSTPVAGADFSGVRAFWRITDQLRRDEDPPPAAWDSLFATPGYAALQARERRRPAITAALRAAFMPSHSAERDSILRVNGWAARVLRHVEPLPARRAELDALIARLQRNDVVGRAVARAGTLLPPGTARRFGRPPVAFIFFLPDGRGYPALIVADLERTRSKDDPIQFFAHEATHFYYAQIGRARHAGDSATATPGTAALRELLTKLHEESIGDQFDKSEAIDFDAAARARQFAADSSWAQYLAEYRTEYDSAPARVRDLDAMLRVAAGNRELLKPLSDSLAKTLPIEGRPLGMYITRAIRRVLGDSRIASTVADPIGWLLAYDEAAHHARCHCAALSRASAALLRSIHEAGR